MKFNGQHIFLIITVLLIPLIAMGTMSAYEAATNRELERPDLHLPSFNKLWVSVQWCVVFLILREIAGKKIFAYVGRIAVAKAITGEERVKKVHRFGDSLFKFFAFGFLAVYGQLVLYDKDWMPWYVGGTVGGTIENAFTDWPFTELFEDAEYYFLCGIGYELQNFVHHLIFLRDQKNFNEMLLHHCVTCMLVFLAYMLNLVKYGSIVFHLHQCTDVFAMLMKTVVDTQIQWLNKLAFILLTTTWATWRLGVFPFLVVLPVKGFDFIPAFHVLFYGLLILAVLHLYWFILFIKMALTFAKEGDIADTQAD